jgi:hypothetical protein
MIVRRAITLTLPLIMLAAPVQAGEADTSRALRLFQQLHGARPPAQSGCEGTLPGIRRPTVGDLVASRLAVFESGENRVSGQCNAAGQCHVDMSHADGEDVSSARFAFRTSGKRAVRSSLRCAFTP